MSQVSTDIETSIRNAIKNFIENLDSGDCFTNEEIVNFIEAKHGETWTQLRKIYPINQGKPYTARVYVAQQIERYKRRNEHLITPERPSNCKEHKPCDVLTEWPGAKVQIYVADWGHPCVKHWIKSQI